MWGDSDETVEDEVAQCGRGGEHEDLYLVIECDRPHAGGARFCLTGVDEVWLGRGARRGATRGTVQGKRRLTLTVPDSHMSGAHAQLIRGEAGWVLADTDSRNGSFVDGRRTNRACVRHGSLFELGHSYFLLRESSVIATQSEPCDSGSPPLEAAGLTLDHGREAGLARLAAVARDGLPILLTGEPGVGKKRLAHALHRHSKRDGHLVAFDCCLAERDAGRTGSLNGFFTAFGRSLERAEGGTLLLSDVAALSSEAQGALLRMLSGAATGQRTALISTLPTDPGAAIEASLRPSLLAYLGAYAMFVPPLRDRKEELGALVASILGSASVADEARYQLDPSLADSLLLHDWPCNVREFENCIRSALALCSDGVLRLGAPAVSLAPTLPSDEAAPSASAEMPIAQPAERNGSSEADPEFAQNVRRALRSNLSIAGLQRNGLLRSYMVLRRTKGSSAPAATVPALRQILLEAIETMRASPRGEKQSRVLHLTFITPTATQHEAADRLAMAFGTYRRYVTAAIAELTTNLWFDELSARFELEQPGKKVSSSDAR